MKKMLLYITLLCIQPFARATDIYNLHDSLLFLAGIANQEKASTLKLASSVTIHLEQGDITKVHNIDAIVNAANKALAGGTGVCGAIFGAAGEKELQEACDVYTNERHEPIGIGEARITPSFKLKEQGIKHIIHAVGPDCRVASQKSQRKTLLTNAYTNSLKLAEANNLKTIAFPFISSAIYACEPDFAATTALDTIINFPYKQNGITDVYMVLFSKADLDLFITKLASYAKK